MTEEVFVFLLKHIVPDKYPVKIPCPLFLKTLISVDNYLCYDDVENFYKQNKEILHDSDRLLRVQIYS